MLVRALVLSLLWVLLTLFSFSCIDDCVCGPPGTYRVTTQGLDLIAYQTQGFGTKPVIDTAFSIAFGLQTNFNQLLDQIAIKSQSRPYTIGNAAFACSCVEPTYQVPDPVKEVNLYLIDPIQGTEVLVSDNFRASYGQELITLDSALRYMNSYLGNQFYRGPSGFLLELVEPASFSGRKQIKCLATLNSGKSFTAVSQMIFFK